MTNKNGVYYDKDIHQIKKALSTLQEKAITASLLKNSNVIHQSIKEENESVEDNDDSIYEEKTETFLEISDNLELKIKEVSLAFDECLNSEFDRLTETI